MSKNMSRRDFLKIASMATAGGILAACQPAAAPAPTAAPISTAAPTATPAPVTIKASVWDYDLYEYDKAMIENFMQKNPNIKVNPLNFPNADYDTKVNTMLSGGEDLDVIYAKSVALFGGMIGKNQVMDLKPLIQKDNLDLKPYGASITAYMTLDDKILGLPYRYDRYLLYYNKDVFDAAGEPYPGPDLTWDDYRALALKITKGTGSTKTYGGFFAPFNYCFVTPGLQEGKGGYDTMDFNLFREGWSNFYAMMYTDKSAPDWPSMKSVSADQTYFLKGTTGMMINGTWFLNLVKTQIDAGKTTIRWGAQRVPVSKAMKAAGVHASNASITPIVINAKSKNVEAAWAMVKHICSEEAGKIAASYLITPGYNSAGVVDAMAQVKGFDPSAKDALLNSGAAYPMGSGANKFLGALSTMVNQQMELLFTQNQDMDKTFSEMDRRRKEILAPQ
jgi:multiple sugar transport system substrate-binding protein